MKRNKEERGRSRREEKRAVSFESRSGLLERAVASYAAGQLLEAETLCRRILQWQENHFDALHLLGVICHKLSHIGANSDKISANGSNRPFREPLDLQRLKEAVHYYDKAVVLNPHFPAVFYNRGRALQDLGRPVDAVADYDRAIKLHPNYVEALYNRATALKGLRRRQEALTSYDRVLALRPNFPDALNNRAILLSELNRLDEALAGYEQAIRLDPDHAYAFGNRCDCLLKLCDWRHREELERQIEQHVLSGKWFSPFGLFAYLDDPKLQLRCAQNFAEHESLRTAQSRQFQSKWRNSRIKIAYVSADFRIHPMAYLLAGLFERHDRSKFEVIGVSLRSDDGSDMRKRLATAFDLFIDASDTSDREVTILLRNLQVDIAVDLMGYTGLTGDYRPKIFADRAAPIQVNYLGFPGTMGAEFIDYIIGDGTVIRSDEDQYYTEKVVRLPDCYQVNDRDYETSAHCPTREDLGLPPDGFVFCCFNNPWKIAPKIFAVWMRLLAETPGSVLWLVGDNPSTESNLRREAEACGLDQSRLVFSARVPFPEYLARHRLADLFLDTLPYNAHATASHALWAGLPVLTCQGHSFSSRVAASLLHALGLDELICYTLKDYETVARRFATDSYFRKKLEMKLKRNRVSYPLFDPERFTAHLESAYMKMWECWQRGENPCSFDVEPVHNIAAEPNGLTMPP